MMESNEFHTQEQSLRDLLKDKPYNAKAMSQLSNLLFETYSNMRQPKSQLLLEESINWARKAVSRMPNKAFTHATLSRVATDINERQKALDCTITTFEETYSNVMKDTIPISQMCAYTLALVRSLVETREEKRYQWSKMEKKIKTKTNKNPMRIDLSKNEIILYTQIKEALQISWSRTLQISMKSISETKCNDMEDISIQKNVKGYMHRLALAEYRLGIFFRKMEPANKHQLSSYKHFKQVIKHLPKNNSYAHKARFWLATLQNKDILEKDSDIDNMKFEKCPQEYIISLYSSFASNFDDLLVNSLDYQTPTILRNHVNALFPSQQQQQQQQLTIWKKSLDLGCGTGLSGIAFRDCVDHLTGVDLSPEMIEKAKERGCYNHLLVHDLESHLLQNKERDQMYDLILACDVFVYIGNLDGIFSNVRDLLIQDGLFVFSTELLQEDEKYCDYILQPTARFAHKQKYIESLCHKYSFQILSLKIDTIRRNKGKDIKGILAILSTS